MGDDDQGNAECVYGLRQNTFKRYKSFNWVIFIFVRVMWGNHYRTI
jgi:hypothetical protein